MELKALGFDPQTGEFTELEATYKEIREFIGNMIEPMDALPQLTLWFDEEGRLRDKPTLSLIVETKDWWYNDFYGKFVITITDPDNENLGCRGLSEPLRDYIKKFTTKRYDIFADTWHLIFNDKDITVNA